jgi:hypothetical protein
VIDDLIELYVGAINEMASCGTVTSQRLSNVYWREERRERRKKRK